MAQDTQQGISPKRKVVSLGWMAVDCNNLVKDGECRYWNSMHCPLNVTPEIKMGKECRYAKSKRKI